MAYGQNAPSCDPLRILQQCKICKYSIGGTPRALASYFLQVTFVLNKQKITIFDHFIQL